MRTGSRGASVFLAAICSLALARDIPFTAVSADAGTGGEGVAWADVNGDDLPDLYVGSLYGNPGWDDTGIGGKSAVAVFADLDNDGDYDLIGDGVRRNDGSGALERIGAEQPLKSAIAFDADGDGDLDLFGAGGFFRNDGAFSFIAAEVGGLAEAECSRGLTGTDYDGDGDIDVICASRTSGIVVLTNERDRFVKTEPGEIGIEHRATGGIATGDVDNDGDLDLLLTGDSNGYLYANRGGGRFELRQEFVIAGGYMGAFADLDQDSFLDIVFAGDSKIYRNDGNGDFLPGSAVPAEGLDGPRGIAFAISTGTAISILPWDARSHRSG